MTSIDYRSRHHDFHGNIFAIGTAAAAGVPRRVFQALRALVRRRRERDAFLNLIDKEDWVYRDLGITRADVEWAARLPLHVNAARELEKLRARSAARGR